MITKRNMTVDYIYRASKIATTSYKCADKRIYKTESTSEGTRPGKLGPPQAAEQVDETSVVSTIDASSLTVWHHSAQGSPLTSSLHL